MWLDWLDKNLWGIEDGLWSVKKETTGITGYCKDCGDNCYDNFDLCGNCLSIKNIKEFNNKLNK
jgi:hypothetical protein